MDMQSFAKENIRLQRRSLDNIFDTLAVMQHFAEQAGCYWLHRMAAGQTAHKSMDRWHSTLHQKRQAYKTGIDRSYRAIKDWLP
jgi:hypothetical protein